MDALARPLDKRWLILAVGAVLLLNLGILLFFEHHLHADFPFEDEWGYLDRLQRLPRMGFAHYLFNSYHTYYGPVLFFFWYLAYAWTHLDIEAIRYAGACLSTAVALLLAVMLYRRAARRDLLLLLLLVCAVFMVCSLNHTTFYLQSIQSVVGPFLFGVVLLACWAGECTLAAGHRALLWGLVCISLALAGTGTYAPGLSILPAIVGAQLLILRRPTVSGVLLGVLGVLLIFFYLHGGHGLSQPRQQPSDPITDLLLAAAMWVGLTGNAVFSHHGFNHDTYTYAMGLLLLAAQAYGFVAALRLPPERRRTLFIPVALTLYNNLVILEIIVARLHNVEAGVQSSFNSRYTMLALAGPVSLLFYAVMLGDLTSHTRRLAYAVLLGLAVGTLGSAYDVARLLPSYARNMAGVRQVLLSLQGAPTPLQQAQMQLNPSMEPFVYPDLLFLKKEHLALYRDAAEETPPTNP